MTGRKYLSYFIIVISLSRREVVFVVSVDCWMLLAVGVPHGDTLKPLTRLTIHPILHR